MASVWWIVILLTLLSLVVSSDNERSDASGHELAALQMGFPPSHTRGRRHCVFAVEHGAWTFSMLAAIHSSPLKIPLEPPPDTSSPPKQCSLMHCWQLIPILTFKCSNCYRESLTSTSKSEIFIASMSPRSHVQYVS